MKKWSYLGSREIRRAWMAETPPKMRETWVLESEEVRAM